MPKDRSNSDANVEIRQILASLRWRIRAYILTLGLAIVLVWAGLTFWLLLGLDYLPVQLGFREMPLAARAIALGVIVGVAAGILYWWIGRRVFVPLNDISLALLIERRNAQLNDALATSVRAAPADAQSDLASDMLQHTQQAVQLQLSAIKQARVLRRRPLLLALSAAITVVLSIVVLAAADSRTAAIAARRFYLLDTQLWPRRSKIEIVGLRVNRETPLDEIADASQLVAFSDFQAKVAQGARVVLLVRAEASDQSGGRRVVPRSCTFRYSTASGQRGALTMNQVGSPRNGYQLFTLDAQPLAGVFSDIQFHVRGGDCTTQTHQIRIVDHPIVVQTELDCEFPEYLVDPESLRWSARTINWAAGTRLPKGTRVKLRAVCNKPLQKVYCRPAPGQSLQSLDVSVDAPVEFAFDIPSLDSDAQLEFILHDQDGVISETVHQVLIAALPDEPPKVETRLSGIGTAVTPDVQIPIQAQVTDDYGVQSAWIELQAADHDVLTEDCPVDPNGHVSTAIDFRSKRQQTQGQFTLPLGDDSRLSLLVRAKDRFDLDGGENIGDGDRFVLEIVSADQLLRMLERLELGQRRRLEQIYLELTEARDYLARAQRRPDIAESAVEPGDRKLDDETEIEPEAETEEVDYRLLFVRRALLQNEKSTEEIRGVAESFEDIRLQLINNRVDTEDRKQRLADSIILPLQLIANQSMQQFHEQTLLLEGTLQELADRPSDPLLVESVSAQSAESLESADLVLVQLQAVLNTLINYESQHELLDIVRQMIKRQQEILERTRQYRSRQVLDGLLD